MLLRTKKHGILNSKLVNPDCSPLIFCHLENVTHHPGHVSFYNIPKWFKNRFRLLPPSLSLFYSGPKNEEAKNFSLLRKIWFWASSPRGIVAHQIKQVFK